MPAEVQGDTITPVRYTEAVGDDADDPAIWVHPSNPARSLMLGTNKVAGAGSLAVFSLDGRTVQTIPSIDITESV